MQFDNRYYQDEALASMHEVCDNESAILSCPTGGGKTHIACNFIRDEMEKHRSTMFIVDRLTLLKQASKSLYNNRIMHDVIQGRRKSLGMQFHNCDIAVASSQTIERDLSILDSFDNLIVDECHTIREQLLDYAKGKFRIIGLTATPMGNGLPRFYKEDVISVTTTNTLLGEGFLVPAKVYIATPIDMKGAKKFGNEWTDKVAGERASKITGDIVKEYSEKVKELGLDNPKTLVYSATVDHGNELLKEFLRAGFNAESFSYQMSQKVCEDKLDRFLDGRLRILISCEKVGKGFDDPEVEVIVAARPYQSSLSSHIQQIGRGMRINEGKSHFHLFDHAGNFDRFLPAMEEFYQYGIDNLESGQFSTCSECERMFPSKSISEDGICRGCAKKRSGKETKTRRVSGESELDKQGGKLEAYKEPEEYRTWKFICSLASIAKPDYAKDRPVLNKWAYIQFKQETGTAPPRGFRFVESTEPIPVELQERVLSRYHEWMSRMGLKDKQVEKLLNPKDPKWDPKQTKQGTMEFLETIF